MVFVPRAVEIDAASFNRVGNAPRVQRRGIVYRCTTRGALPTRLNEPRTCGSDVQPLLRDVRLDGAGHEVADALAGGDSAT